MRVEKLNGDLHQPSGIRYVLRSFSVRCLVSLAYREGIDFSGIAVCCGTELATTPGRFLFVSLWGFLVFNVLEFLLFLCFYVESGGMFSQ